MSDELLEKIVVEFYARDGFDLCSDVVLKLDRAIQQGDLAKNLLSEIADELDEWHYKSSIAKVVGSSAGIGGAIAGVGGTITAVGVFLSPFTVGTSAVIGIAIGGIVGGVGGVVAVGGTGTVVGTQIVNKCHNNSLLKRAQVAIDDYSTYRNSVAEAWKKIENMCHAISIEVKLFGVEAIMNFAWQIFLNAKEYIGDAKGILGKLKAMGEVFAIRIPVSIVLATLAFGISLCGYNIFELVISAKVIHKKEPHPAAVEIRNKAIIELNTEVEKLQKVKTSLDNECIS